MHSNSQKQLPAPFVVYADSEAVLTQVDIAHGRKTRVYQQHMVNHIGAVVISRYPALLNHDYIQFDGPDCVDRFLQWLFGIEARAVQLVSRNVPMRLTRADWEAHALAATCHICGKRTGDDKVRDHDHLTGAYRGAAHKACNLAYSYKGYRLPVFFHNLARYDGHFILQHAGKFNRRMTCLAKNAESFLSFSIGRCVFKDTAQFLLASLDEAVSGLNAAAASTASTPISELFPSFEHAFAAAPLELRTLLRQKGVFPYDWFDSTSKLGETALPSFDAFDSKLTGERASDKDVTRANNVWYLAGCRTMYDYLSLYLKTGVVLLADVFEAFRSIMQRNYGLDPTHYFTLPGYSWDAMLRTTGVTIQCLDQRLDGAYDMLDMIRRSIRGGVSMISTRYAKANNRYLGTATQQARYAADASAGHTAITSADESVERYGWDATQPASYIMYWDANNLYGGAMSDPLPHGDFTLQTDVTLDDVLSLRLNATRGCFAEVDMAIPDELRDALNDYPLAPEQTAFDPSPRMAQLLECLGLPQSTTPKLIPNLRAKTRYVLHYRALQQCVRLGYKVTAIHRALWFTQSRFLAGYIDLNTRLRAAATNEFEKRLFKLMNNAVYGKTIENVEKRVNVVLTSDDKAIRKYASRPDFQDIRLVGNGLAAILLRKGPAVYDKPIHVGAAVLDVSKVHMYDFHYGYVRVRYGDAARLLFTDTDSLTYHITTPDVYDDMRAELHRFDTSDYPRDHPCYSATNKKVVLKFKDELSGVPIRAFIGLRAKMYAYLTADSSVSAKAKGVKACAVKKLRWEAYRAALFGETSDNLRQDVTFNVIRSRNHQLSSLSLTKTGLCAYDDKRYVGADNIHTLAHGHWRTRTGSEDGTPAASSGRTPVDNQTVH